MVDARYAQEGERHTLVLLGHANYAQRGKDIVCAGVSALVQALIGWIEANPCADKCVSIESGEVIISCKGDVSAVFDLAMIGLGQIAKAYPDHVHIDIGQAD